MRKIGLDAGGERNELAAFNPLPGVALSRR